MPDELDRDDRLLAVLADALHGDVDVPRSVLEAGYGAFTWRNIDVELAALTYDSTDVGDSDYAAFDGTRAERAPLRAMTFASSALTIELEVVPEALIGQLVGGRPVADLIVEFRDGRTSTLAVDDTGYFAVRPIPVEEFRLRLVSPDRGVATTWITL